jgi:type 1 glutamine amidotransferase
MGARAAAALLACPIAGCSSPEAPSPRQTSGAGSPASIRVLMLTATAAFRHDSIPAARQAMAAIAARTGEFTVSATEGVTEINMTRLASVDVLMFAQTSGELPFDPSQKSAIIDFVSNGGGFVGIHSAADTLYEWPDYGRLVGAYFKEHPWTQEAVVSATSRKPGTTRASKRC